jgi:5-methylcytosine-specific restriction endonuclease McrA
LLEQARDLLKHQIPDRDLARVQRLAIEALLEKLTKRKFAATIASQAQVMTTTIRGDAPHVPMNLAGPEPTPRVPSVDELPVMASVTPPDPTHAVCTLAAVAPDPSKAATAPPDPPQSAPTLRPAATFELAQAAVAPHDPLHLAWASTPTTTSDVAQSGAAATTDPAQAMAIPTCTTPRPDRPRFGRHIPASVKRAVWLRDAGRCSYVDNRGQHCRETAGLEFHHRTPYAQGGASDADNVTLHCRAHNGLAAERDFGRDFMERSKRGEPSRRIAAESLERCPDA